MTLSPFDLIQDFDLKKVVDIARDILSKIGIWVPRADLRDQISATGRVKVDGERILIPGEVYDSLLEEIENSKKEVKLEKKPATLFIYASEWPFFFIDPEDLQIRPFDKEHLIAYTKLIDSFYGTDIAGTVPGRVQDEPPPLREIVTYYIECRYSRSARFPLVGDENIFPWMRMIAEVMGHSLYTTVYVFSPLTFHGNSLNLALKFRDLFPSVGIASMPILGISAPLEWHTAWGQAVAEALGGCILLKLLGFENVNFDINIYSGSMESGAVVFGSPEHFLCALTRAKVREFFGITYDSVEAMLTTAIMPGPQACAEKASLTTISALAGFRTVEGAGTLGIDEIFSPQQFMLDIEIKGYVERLLRGLDLEDTENPLELIQEGLADTHFLSATWTIKQWRKFFWRPLLFHQLKVPQWMSRSKGILEEAWEKAKAKIEENDYELEPSKIKELDKIIDRARKELA